MRTVRLAVLLLAPFISTSATATGASTPGCRVELSGAVQGSFGCVVTANYYFEGGSLIEGRKNTLVSLIALGADLPKELRSVSINIEIPSEPRPGKIGQSQTLPATSGAVVTKDNRVFDRVDELTLDLTSAKVASTAEPQGFDVSRVYTLRGSLRFTVSDKTGQVTVTSSF
jgi:hypothetical protein